MVGRKGLLITIDGPAGSGKSTVSKLLANRLGLFYLDTGAMYRAVALQAKRTGTGPEDAKGLAELCSEMDLRFERMDVELRLFIGQEDVSLAIRTPEMDLLSSRISGVPQVRAAMTMLQQRMGRDGGLVAEGRDMGTVVFPEARHKFFITASPEVRAERRALERLARGERITREEVERELRLRDDQDSRRAIAPLIRAEDATLIDTTTLNPGQVVEVILGHVQEKEKERDE